MGMLIRENKSLAYWSIGHVWVITVPSGPYRWSLSHTMITVPSGPYKWSLSRAMITAPPGPYRPLFHTVSISPSGPYSFIYQFLRFMQT